MGEDHGDWQGLEVSPELAKRIERATGLTVVTSTPVGGGCIAHAQRLNTSGGPFFLKWARGDAATTFLAEAEGLRTLRAAGSPLLIPDVVAVESETAGSPAFLVSEWIEQGTAGADFWERFGRGLALLHTKEAKAFGFANSNFIGRLPQVNTPSNSWVSFFREERLLPQIQIARRTRKWSASWDRPVEKLLASLDRYLPQKPPASIVHGDLWGGNFLCVVDGRAALIDPAVYYGHREVDLAMTELFGGFAARFYSAYEETWPLQPGYEDRRDLYNLYHLINHLNHFGGSYSGGVSHTLKRFGS